MLARDSAAFATLNGTCAEVVVIDSIQNQIETISQTGEIALGKMNTVMLGPQASAPARVQPSQEEFPESLDEVDLVLLDMGRWGRLRSQHDDSDYSHRDIPVRE